MIQLFLYSNYMSVNLYVCLSGNYHYDFAKCFKGFQKIVILKFSRKDYECVTNKKINSRVYSGVMSIWGD